jgi:(2Fe-2S) ferredoxin
MIRIVVCVNKRRPPQPSCGARLDTKKVLRHLRRWLSERGVTTGSERVEVTATRCLDQCVRGPVLAIQPPNRCYTYHSVDEAEKLIRDILA